MKAKKSQKPVALVLSVVLVLVCLVQPCLSYEKRSPGEAWKELKATPNGLTLGIGIGTVAGLALGFVMFPASALCPVLVGVLGGITGGFFGAFFSGMSFDSKGPDPKIYVEPKAPLPSNNQRVAAPVVKETSPVRMGNAECQEAYKQYIEACKKGNPEKAKAAMARYNELRVEN